MLKTLPEAQRTQGVDCRVYNLSLREGIKKLYANIPIFLFFQNLIYWVTNILYNESLVDLQPHQLLDDLSEAGLLRHL